MSEIIVFALLVLGAAALYGGLLTLLGLFDRLRGKKPQMK